jgi:hypothetical protein
VSEPARDALAVLLVRFAEFLAECWLLVRDRQQVVGHPEQSGVETDDERFEDNPGSGGRDDCAEIGVTASTTRAGASAKRYARLSTRARPLSAFGSVLSSAFVPVSGATPPDIS